MKNFKIELEQLAGKLRALQKMTEVKEIMRQLGEMPKHELKIPKKQRPPVRPSGTADVAEVYSLPRISEVAEKMGLKGAHYVCIDFYPS